MPDFDKWQSIVQTAGILGGIIGGALLALFGKRATQKSSDDEPERGLVREERARLLALQNQVAEDRMRRDWEAALGATRKSFYDQSQKLSDEFKADYKRLDDRLRELERRRPSH